MARYVAGTVVICAFAGVIGETFFPVQVIGDTGENDFEGLAFMIWSLFAFMLCLLAAAAWEVRLWVRVHQPYAGARRQ